LIKPAFNSGSISGTWIQCNDYCPTTYPGATMLCVNNAAENDWITSQSGGGWIWIGYTDMLPYGGGKGTKQYGWVTGCSSTYTNWRSGHPGSGQPDNMGNNEDYAATHPIYLWDDGSSQDQTSCGCEYNSAQTTTSPSTVPSFRSSNVPSSNHPSSGPTSSPTATRSFEPSEGSVSE